MKKQASLLAILLMFVMPALADHGGPPGPDQPLLIDVRTPEEYKAGHFEKAINFDSVDIDAGKTPQVAKDAKIYVYCRSGNRSAASTAKLKAAGFTNIIDLGGLEDVKTIGGGELVE